MIPANDPLLYDAALASLSRHRKAIGRRFKGRFIQIFLGLKFSENNIPSMFSGSFVSTQVLETLLDDLYGKASRPLNDSVLILFQNSYVPRTGLKVGKKTAENTWRNNFNLQKGISCCASPNDLASQHFLDQSRAACKYLAPGPTGGFSGAYCSLKPTKTKYRGESQRKWLRRDTHDEGYAVVDFQNVSNFSPYVAPNGKRLPALPTIVALYHDANPGLLVGQRPQVDIDQFRSDFNLSLPEFSAYFDDDPSSAENSILLRRFPSVTFKRATAAPVRPVHAVSRRTRSPSPPTLPPPGTPVAPPATNSGFEAEQFVEDALAAQGWTVHNVSRQQMGYDLLVKKGKTTRYIEVKSSLGNCSPTLTSREWQQAEAHGAAYILSVIENFNPSGKNNVYWIPDPANTCSATPSKTINYTISRSSWRLAAVPLASI